MTGWWLASYVVLWVVVGALAVLVVALARQVGTLHLRLGPRGALEMDEEGPALGEAPAPVDAVDVEGRPVQVAGPGEPQLVMFVSPDCPICRQVLPGLPAAARAGGLAPLVVTDAAPGEAAAAYRHQGVGAPVVAGRELAEAYGVPGTPYAVITDRLGVVRAKGTINNLEQLEGLVDTARRRTREALPAGLNGDGAAS